MSTQTSLSGGWNDYTPARKAEYIFYTTYNNNNLTTEQKAQQINQLALINNISRDQIATALGISLANLNAYLDQDPTVISSLLATANDSSYKPEDYTYETDYEGTQYRVLSKQGLAAKQARADAGRRLEALGYELFDPDGPEYGDEFASYGAAPAKWLSPQEAASVKGTKVNQMLVNQAYVQSTDNLASQLSPLANQFRQRLDAVNASGNLLAEQPARFFTEIANRFTQQTGITNLDDIGVKKLDVIPTQWTDPSSGELITAYERKDNGQLVSSDIEIYDKRTGRAIGLPNLGTFGNQRDETGAYLGVTPDGQLKLKAYYAYEQEAWKDVVTALAPIALNFVPGVGQFVGAAILPAGISPVIQNAVGNMVLKTGIDVAAGLPIETAIKNNLATFGVNQLMPNFTGNNYIDNAIKAVTSASLTGLDVETALTNSLIATTAQQIASKLDIEKSLGPAGGKLITDLAIGAMSGKPIEQILTDAAINTTLALAVNSIATENALTPEEKGVLTIAGNAAIQAARTGSINPHQLMTQLYAITGNNKEAAKIVAAEAKNIQNSNTVVGAVSSDSSGNLYTTDDDGNRLVLTGADAGRIYTAAEWNGIQAALNTGQSQFVSAVIKNMNDGVFTPEEAQQELKDAGYTDTQIQKVIDANQQYLTRAANAKSIIQEYTTPGSGYDRATALAALQRDAGYSAEDAEKVLGNLDTNLRNQRSVGQFINAYAEPGSDVSRDAVIDQLKGLTINGQRQYSDADIEKLVGDADKVTTARNSYANITRDFLSGAATEKQLTDAMDAAGITGQARTDQLTYYRAIKAGSELTSSEATQAAVAGLNTWNLIPDRKGTQVVFALNDEGTPYVKEARDAQGRDVTNLFYGSSPQALQQYVTQENQKYVDRMKSTLTKTAESFFAPGGAMTDAQAITALKATGLTEAMAKDVVAGWNSQKEAIGRNSLNINQENRTTSRMLSFEEFERMLGAVNVKDKLTERYQAYVTTNNAIYSLGKLPDGQFLFPGEVTAALDRSAAVKELPRNSTVDAIAQEVYKGIQAGSEVGSPAQNLINSLNANFLSLFPRVGAGITSVVMGDAANDVAVILRGIAEIGSKSSDLLMPDLAAEANRRMADISNADGFVNKMVKAWDWATASPLSFGSLAWTAGKELSEDMISFALLGKALKTVGSAPGKALGLTFTDLALNYGGIAEENIAELIQQGLNPQLAAQLAGQGAMPAALAETIIGTVFAALPIDKVTKNSAFRNLIATPYHANVDGLEETGSYLANQIGMGKPVELNDALTSYVIGSTVGGKANVITSVGDMLTGQGQGNLLRSIDEAGLKTGIDASIIPNDVKATVLSVTNDIAVVKLPSGGSYILDVSNQDLKPNDVINIKAFDVTVPDIDADYAVNLTEAQTKQLVADVSSVFKQQTGQDLTYAELAPNLNQYVGKTQSEITEIVKATPEAQVFTRAKTVFNDTLGRDPTQSEIKTVLNEGTALTDQQIKTYVESLPEYTARQASISVSKSISESISISEKIASDAAKALSISRSISQSISSSISSSLSTSISTSESISQSTSQSISFSISESTSASLQRAADEVATQSWVAPDGKTYQIPKLWGEYTESQKIKWFNDNNWDAVKLQSIGISNDDIAYLVGKGVTKGAWKTAAEIAEEAEAQRISTSNSISLSELEVENKRTIDWTSPNGTVIKIPAKWATYTSDQKIAWLNEQKITATSFKNMGHKDADIVAYVELGLERGGWRSEAEIAAEEEANRIKISQDAVKAASISQSLSQSESIRLREAEEAEAKRISTSESISLSQKLSEQAKAEADRISTSNSISLSQKLAAEEKAEADRISTSKSISESISISNKIKEDAAKAVSVSKSISESQSTSLSTSKSISTSQSISESTSKSISTAASISASKSQSIFASTSQSISESTSQSISTVASISTSKSQSISASTSQSISTVASISASISQSTSLSQSLSASVSDSISQSISNSISASISKVVSTSQSISASQSASVSTIASISQSISNSISASISEDLARDVRENTSASISNSISESIAMDRSTSISISKSVSISERLKTLDENQRASLSNSISISDSLSQSASISVANSVSQSLSQALSQSISQSISESASQSISTTVSPSVTVSESTAVSQSISATISPSASVTQSVSTTVEPTVSVTTSINPSVTVSVTETTTESVTITFSPTLVITTPTPSVTETLAVTTPPPTIPWPPTLSFTETTSMPVTTTEAPTTTKPVTTKPVTTKPGPTTTPPPFPLFMVPGYDQTKRYIDYAQPNVPAPQFGPYDPFKAPNYLRPLQDAGNFGIAALVGAFNDGKPGNGGNQPK